MDDLRIVTDRFVLRPLRPDDATPRYSAWFDEPQAARYIVSAGKHHDLATLRRYIEERTGRADVLFLGIFVRDGCRHIGNIKFEPVDDREGYAVMGILIGECDWRGKGTTAEVLEAAMRWLGKHRRIREVVLGVEREHIAAVHAYERAGFRVEATTRIAVDSRSQITMVRRLQPESA